MNANELADELENRHQWKLLNHIHWSEQAATMLRQQQAEIEVLKNRPAINKEDGLVCAKCYERIGQ
jgi:hypothetical protein